MLQELHSLIRAFLHPGDLAAQAAGLEVQQHQALVTIRASRDPAGPTINEVARALRIRHHSAGGLIDRLAGRGLVERERSSADKREVRVRLTEAGELALRSLAPHHRDELRSAAPALLRALSELLERAAGMEQA